MSWDGELAGSRRQVRASPAVAAGIGQPRGQRHLPRRVAGVQPRRPGALRAVADEAVTLRHRVPLACSGHAQQRQHFGVGDQAQRPVVEAAQVVAQDQRAVGAGPGPWRAPSRRAARSRGRRRRWGNGWAPAAGGRGRPAPAAQSPGTTPTWRPPRTTGCQRWRCRSRRAGRARRRWRRPWRRTGSRRRRPAGHGSQPGARRGAHEAAAGRFIGRGAHRSCLVHQ
jgi:hypothetical protein